MPFQGWGREEILFKFSKFQGVHLFTSMGLPGGSVGKESACNVGDLGLYWEDPLEEGMATHSSILAWEILWTEEPGWLQSMGSQKVRHD